MPTKSNDGDKRGGKQKSALELKTRIIERIAYGPEFGESERQWLKGAEKITIAAAKTLDKIQISLAWMEGISTLCAFEAAHNADANDALTKFIHLSMKSGVKRPGPTKNAATALKILIAAEEFASVHNLLNRKDIEVAVAAGKKLDAQIEEASNQPLDLGAAIDDITAARNEIYKNIKKSD